MGWFRKTEGDGNDTPSFAERLAQIGPGAPGRCPACDGLGYIDSIDIGRRYQVQRCTVCKHRWEYLFDAEGAVVGLTELDDLGQPVARSRVRPARSAPAAAEKAELDDDDDDVLDLREPAVAEVPAVDLTEGERLSPAEWIRRSTRL